MNMVEQDRDLPEWRHSVAQMARLMKPADWSKQGIFLLSSIFYLPRPKCHFNARGDLKRGAPVFHSNRKDCDKMLRAIGDALTEICYEDDSLVVFASALKVYCSPTGDGEGARISVARLDEALASSGVQAILF